MSHSTSGRTTQLLRAYGVDLATYHEPGWRSPLERTAARRLTRRRVSWRYEEHRFTLADGQIYTPDLWCPQIGVFIEVKGDRAPERLDKPARLAWQLDPRELWHRVSAYGDVVDEWTSIGVEYREVLDWPSLATYAIENARRAPQVWIWTQTQLVHAGHAALGCEDQRSSIGR